MTLSDYDDLIPHAAKKVGMPEKVCLELLKEWRDFCREHVGEHPEDISFEYELFPTKVGVISVCLEPEGDHVNLTIKAEDMESCEMAELDPVPPEAWEPIFPTLQRKSDKRIPPNVKCPCGSGKKFKRCCARVSLLMEDVAQAEAGAGEGEGSGA